MTKAADGLYLVYVKDGIAYPVSLSAEQQSLFDMMMPTLGRITALKDYPMGEAGTIPAKPTQLQ